MRDFIDYAGRGTTTGLFIGFTIALIQGDPFGLVVTVISVVGAIIGAISCLVRIDLAKNDVNRLDDEKYKNHVRVMVKSIISILCMYLFLNAYFLIAAILHGAKFGG